MSSKLSRKKQTQTNRLAGLSLIDVEPLTATQEIVFEEFKKGQHLNLHGFAGTGKSFLALYLALRAVEQGEQKKIVIFRSPVAARSMGFLPGNEKEKMAIYAKPYMEMCSQLFDRGDAWQILERNNIIHFASTSFERGRTYDDTILIVDECQSMCWNELNTICTRVGEESRIIFCGDYRQTDLRFEDERAGHRTFYKILNTMDSISSIEFKIDDIVRSGWCRQWIEASIKFETENNTSLLRLI